MGRRQKSSYDYYYTIYFPVALIVTIHSTTSTSVFSMMEHDRPSSMQSFPSLFATHTVRRRTVVGTYNDVNRYDTCSFRRMLLLPAGTFSLMHVVIPSVPSCNYPVLPWLAIRD